MSGILRILIAVMFLLNWAIGLAQDEDKAGARDQYPSLSPDGQWIAFQSNIKGNFDIFVMRSDGSEVRQMTRKLADDIYPSWSPDGKRILFQSDRGGRAELGTQDLDVYAVALDGGEIEVLVDSPFNDFFPALSPDGQKIAFTSDERGDRNVYNIFLLDLARGERSNLTPALAETFDPAWSPDGSRVAFSAPNPSHDGLYDIYSVALDGKGLLNLTDNPQGDDFNPAWSAQGQIAYQVGVGDTLQIAVLKLDGGKARVITSGPTNHEPSWSSDGKRLVFTSWRDGNAEIYLMNADGSDQKRLTNQ